MLSVTALSAAEPLMLCGGAECFVIDTTKPVPEKLWSWRAKDRPELPESLAKAFGTTTDVKFTFDNKHLLISSSGGGCAKIGYPSGMIQWSARVGNAHSLTELPGERILVAGSLGANKLVLFEPKYGDKILWETPCHSAHGVVWDQKRERVYALNFNELRCYQLHQWSTETPQLVLEYQVKLPDEDGHDLVAVYGADDLIVSTGHHVWLFDRQQRAFRPHPAWKDHAEVKSVDVHPKTARAVMIQAQQGKWWSHDLVFDSPAGKLTLSQEILYKARWLTQP